MRRLEANANHGVAAASATSPTAADDTRTGKRLLANMRRFGQRCGCCLRPARLLLVTVAAGLLLLVATPVPVVLARGGRRRGRRSGLRLDIGNAGVALQAFAALAFDWTNAGRVLGQFGNQALGHDRIVGRLTFDRQIVAERSEEHTSELQSRRELVCRL